MAEGLGGNGGEGDAALGDAEEGVETGGAAWFGWGMHVSDSRLALGRGGFRFSGLELVENEEEKKVEAV
jgi:hypothetical protein